MSTTPGRRTVSRPAKPVQFEPLVPQPAYGRVASAIEQKILDRSLRPGDPLPTETDLANQFGVNRSTVREALRRLESAGLEIERFHQDRIERIQRLADVGELATIITHELKNPLAGISGAVQLIADDLEPDDPRRQIITTTRFPVPTTPWGTAWRRAGRRPSLILPTLNCAVKLVLSEAAAVDDQGLPGHKAGQVRSQEQD